MALQENQEPTSPEPEPSDSFVHLVNNVEDGNYIEIISENVENEMDYFVMDVEDDGSINFDNSSFVVSSVELLENAQQSDFDVNMDFPTSDNVEV